MARRRPAAAGTSGGGAASLLLQCGNAVFKATQLQVGPPEAVSHFRIGFLKLPQLLVHSLQLVVELVCDAALHLVHGGLDLPQEALHLCPQGLLDIPELQRQCPPGPRQRALEVDCQPLSLVPRGGAPHCGCRHGP